MARVPFRDVANAACLPSLAFLYLVNLFACYFHFIDPPPPGFPQLLPGFIDIHNHGLGGAADMVDSWTVPDYTLSRLPRLGTTSVVGSVVFFGDVGRRDHHSVGEGGDGDGGGSSKADTTGEGDDEAGKRFWAIFDALSSRLGKAAPGCAVVEGIHAEGPVVADLGGLPVN